jgi:hypothetical protein
VIVVATRTRTGFDLFEMRVKISIVTSKAIYTKGNPINRTTITCAISFISVPPQFHLYLLTEDEVILLQQFSKNYDVKNDSIVFIAMESIIIEYFEVTTREI